MDNYPAEGKKVLGFLTYKVIYFLQLDHIYSAPYFYALIALLVAQLIACTHTRQWPIAKVTVHKVPQFMSGVRIQVAKRWRFVKTPKGIAAKDNAEILPDANIRDLGMILHNKGYEVHRRQLSAGWWCKAVACVTRSFSRTAVCMVSSPSLDDLRRSVSTLHSWSRSPALDGASWVDSKALP